MISQTRVIARLIKERRQWKRELIGVGEYKKGFIAGLNYAIAEIEEEAKITKERMKDNPHYLAILYRKGK